MDHAIVQDLVRAIEVKDLSTAAHTWRVVLYTRAMAEAAGLDHGLIDRLTTAAALHDVGKLEVPDAILQKPGRLSPEEYAVVKRHSAAGHDLLRGAGETDDVVLGLVRHHHEHVDGTGYPDGLAGDAIPLAARYFAVIDSFDALTSIRPYRHDVGQRAAERALEELWAKRDAWYCLESVDLLTTLYRRGSLGWILDYCNDSCPIPAYQPVGAASSLEVVTTPPSRRAAAPR